MRWSKENRENICSMAGLQINTNLVENAIRPTAVGKRNWLFIGEAETGDRAAILTPHRMLSPPRHRSLFLPVGCAKPPSRHDQLAGPRSNTRRMGQDPI